MDTPKKPTSSSFAITPVKRTAMGTPIKRTAMDTPKIPTSSAFYSTPVKRMAMDTPKIPTSSAFYSTPVKTTAVDTPKKPTSSAFSSSTPVKRTAPVPVLDLVTPEKREPPPRRRSVAFSVKGVRHAALGLRKKKERSDLDDLAMVEKQLKGDAPARSKSRSRSRIELPPKFQMLREMFNSMVSSIRLLGLKNHKLSFRNIFSSMRFMDSQSLTYNYLAQMKYLLPDVIMLKKVLLRDEITCCMKPELQVTLVEGLAINKNDKDQNAYLQLREAFKQRLVDFLKDHSEEDEIPESELPHPFNSYKTLNTPKILPENSSQILQPQSVTLSHMAPTFQRRFSKKAPIINPNSAQTPESKSEPKDCFVNSDFDEGTPAKSVISTHMETGISTPKNKTGKSNPVSDLSSRKSARTKLFMSPNKIIKENEDRKEKGKEIILDDDYDDELGFLPKSLRESIKEKERKVKEEKETGFDEKIKRQKMLRLLPATFNMISKLLLSENKSIITKRELIHKLISNNLKINDQGEVEEQLKLLQEIVPNWISEETSLFGDILYRVDMKCDSQEIHQRLANAN